MKGLFPAVLLVFLALSAVLSMPSASLPWSIISNPDPPPLATVGVFYKVEFTTSSGYVIDQWICEPENPVPGLHFSDMTGVKKITLSGKPRQEGKYVFTLKAIYKGELMAQRTFIIQVIPKSFNIYMIIIKPAYIMPTSPPTLRPRAIYVGDEVQVIFFTDNPDAKRITWRGTNPIPGTSFYVVKRYKFTQKLPPNVLAAVSRQLLLIDPDAPILVMDGKATQEGDFTVTVKAEDSYGRIRTADFQFTVHGVSCRLTLTLSPSSIDWDITYDLFPPPSDPQYSTYTFDARRKIDVLLQANCHGIAKLITGKLRIYAPKYIIETTGLNDTTQTLVLSGNTLASSSTLETFFEIEIDSTEALK